MTNITTEEPDIQQEPRLEQRSKRRRLSPTEIAARQYLSDLLSEMRSLGLSVSESIEPSWETIYELERRLLEKAPPVQLQRRAWIIRNRYHEVAGEPKYALYVASNPPALPADGTTMTAEAAEALRADLLELHRETVRETIFSEALEQQRALLSTRLGWMSLGILTCLGLLLATPWLNVWARYVVLILVVAFVVGWILWVGVWRRRAAPTIICLAVLLMSSSSSYAFPQPAGPTQGASPASEPFMPLTTLTMVAMAGFLGGAFSVVRRVQSPATEGDAIRNLQRLVAAESYIVLAPISGAIAALVLYAFFCGGFFEGALFPKVTCSPGGSSPVTFKDFLNQSGPATCADQGKVLVWCFIAGFAERFVPDAIDRLTKSAEKK